MEESNEKSIWLCLIGVLVFMLGCGMVWMAFEKTEVFSLTMFLLGIPILVIGALIFQEEEKLRDIHNSRDVFRLSLIIVTLCFYAFGGYLLVDYIDSDEGEYHWTRALIGIAVFISGSYVQAFHAKLKRRHAAAEKSSNPPHSTKE